MSFIKAFFQPIMPPKNYSFEERDFENEYKQMKREYLKRLREGENDDSIPEIKLNMPLAYRLR